MGHRRQRRSAGRAKLAAALDLDREHAVALFAGDIGQFAVIHRLDEARLDQAAFEKFAAPFCDRQMHHIGHHVDTGHQPAAKADSASPPCRRASCFRSVLTCCRPRPGTARSGLSCPFPLFSGVSSDNLRQESDVASVFWPVFPLAILGPMEYHADRKRRRFQTKSQPQVPELNITRIYVDADACPVKDEIYRVAGRHGLPVSVVADSFIRVPQDPLIERVAAVPGWTPPTTGSPSAPAPAISSSPPISRSRAAV